MPLSLFTGQLFGVDGGGGGTPGADSEDIRLYYSIADGPGLANPQPTPSQSLGGFVSHSEYRSEITNSLFPNVTSETTIGQVLYRCIFFANISESRSTGLVALTVTDESDAFDIRVGLDAEGVSDTNAEDQQSDIILSESSAPDGVTFSTSLIIPTIAPGRCIAIWLKRTVVATSTKFNNTIVLNFESVDT